jgi:hypothetical protein
MHKPDRVAEQFVLYRLSSGSGGMMVNSASEDAEVMQFYEFAGH